MPQPGGWAPGQADGGSPADTAKEQARSVAGDVKGQTQQVAGHAADEAKQVVDQAKTQFMDLLWQSRSELTQQANGQQQRLAEGLRSFGQELDEMVSGSQRQGLAIEAASQLSGRIHEAADFLDTRDFPGVLEELTHFARRRPGAFLLGAALIGVAAGRVTRGITADSEDSAETGSDVTAQRTPYEGVRTDLTVVEPAPYADTADTAYQPGPVEPLTDEYAFPQHVTEPPDSDALTSLPDNADRSRL